MCQRLIGKHIFVQEQVLKHGQALEVAQATTAKPVSGEVQHSQPVQALEMREAGVGNICAVDL